MINWEKINIPVLTPTIIQKEKNSVLIKVVNTPATFIEFIEKVKIEESFIEDFIIAENLSPEIQNLESLRSADKDAISKVLSSLRSELKAISQYEPDIRKAGLARQLYAAYDSEHLFVDSPASSTIGFFSSTDLLLDETLIEFATRMDYLKVRLNPQMVRNTTDIVMRYVDGMDDKATFKSFREELTQALGIIDTNDELYDYVYNEEGINYTHLLQVIAGNTCIKTPHAFCSQLGKMTDTELDSHNLDPKQRPKKLRDILSRLSSDEQTILNHNI